MTRRLSLYADAVPVSRVAHGDLWIDLDGFGFARTLTAVPLVMAELGVALRDMPVVFSVDDGAVMPAGVLAAPDGLNGFVTEDGRWRGRYVPAFLRRHPFVLSRSADGDRLTLCLDDTYPGLNRAGRGERLFDVDGARTPFTERMLTFAARFHTQFEATRELCARLLTLNLLRPAKAQFRAPGAGARSLGGFSMVDRAALGALPDELVLELARSRLLELCHLHLASLEQPAPRDRPAGRNGDDRAPALKH